MVVRLMKVELSVKRTLHLGSELLAAISECVSTNNGVFTGIFTCLRVACEDAERAAYSQLHLHVTGEYNHQQAGISCQNHRNVARCPVYTQQVSLVLALALAKVRNFGRVANKMQRLYATAFSCLLERC